MIGADDESDTTDTFSAPSRRTAFGSLDEESDPLACLQSVLEYTDRLISVATQVRCTHRLP